MLVSEQIPKEDLDYILEPFKEDKEEENDKQIISEKIIAIVRDAKGKIIDKREQKMRSLTQYYFALMSIAILGTYSITTSNTATGILTNVLGLPSQQSIYSGTAIITFDTSIQLGSGTQSFSLTLNSLNAPIGNGSGTGQLYNYAQEVSYASNSISQILIVSNNSGNTITVSEIGLMGTIYLMYINSSNNYVAQPYNFLFSYDTFSSPISIPNGGSASFQIVITFSG
ncbi:MAG: YbaB/EbfC family nucleoid-associated protein [Candidatus Nanopusillus acidilobi]